VVRYDPPGNHFFAGIGGFGTKFFIGRSLQGSTAPLSGVGRRRAILKDRKYRLRVDFSGSQIALYENDVRQLEVQVEETHQMGQLGLRSWRSRVRFENVSACRARPRAFLIMPFEPIFDFVHEVLENSTMNFGIDCTRADQIAISQPVMDDVKKKIAEADLVIVDFSGKNPNVYYEAGLADAMGKDWIFLVQDTSDLTFDVRHIRSIQYANVMGANKKLKNDFEKALRALGYVENPIEDT
jgi:hypothetical protein